MMIQHPARADCNAPPFPPPLGDLSTRRLIALLLEEWRTGQRPTSLRARGVHAHHVRAEIARRERVGLGVV